MVKNTAIDYVRSNEPQAKVKFKEIIGSDDDFDYLTKKYLLDIAL